MEEGRRTESKSQSLCYGKQEEQNKQDRFCNTHVTGKEEMEQETMWYQTEKIAKQV